MRRITKEESLKMSYGVQETSKDPLELLEYWMKKVVEHRKKHPRTRCHADIMVELLTEKIEGS